MSNQTNENDFKYKPTPLEKGENISDTPNIPSSAFFCPEGVRASKKPTPPEIIEVLLKSKNLKKSELAQMIGMTRQSINHYLHGFWAIPNHVKIKIAQALEVDSAVIWEFKEDIIPQKTKMEKQTGSETPVDPKTSEVRE